MHVLILGTTLSGKTTLAKRLAEQHRRRGFVSLVLDPLGDPGWPTPYVYQDRAAFLAAAQSSQRCMLFVDEAGEMVGQHHEEMRWCATRARHLGHTSHFMAQRAAMIAPTVRSQCATLCLFRVSRQDAAELAREWARDELAAAAELEAGQCLVVPRFGPVERIDVFSRP